MKDLVKYLKFFSMLLVFLILFSYSPGKYQLNGKNGEIIIILQIGNKIMSVNGALHELDSPPVILNGRTLVPIRAIIEAIGGTISWDASLRKVTIKHFENTIELWIGNNTAMVNGSPKQIDPNNPDVVPLIIKGRTMLPLRFVVENIGCTVLWEGKTQTITITYKEKEILGKVEINSIPSGAKVYINDVFKGLTPLILELPLGIYTMKISMSEYEDYTTTVNIKDATLFKINVELKKLQEKGSLHITSTPDGAKVFLNGIYKGLTPLTIQDLETGNYTLKLTKEGFKDEERTVIVEKNKTTTVSVNLEPLKLTGALDIRSDPAGAGVYLNNEYKGVTPILLFDLPIGNYIILIKKNNYKEETRNVLVEANKTIIINISLTKVLPSKTIVWQKTFGGLVQSSILLKDHFIYVQSDDKYLYCLKEGDGAEVWKTNINSGGGANEYRSGPAISKEKIYIGSSDKNLYCIDKSNGSIAWKKDLGAMIVATPVIYEEIIYIGALNGNLYAMKTEDGSIIWTYDSPQANAFASSCWVIENKIFVGGNDNYFYCINRNNGELVWRFKTGESIRGRCCIFENYVYFGSWDNHLYCLNIDDGTIIFKFETSDWIPSSPAVYDGNVYFGSGDTYFYCIDAKTGTFNWKFKTNDYITARCIFINEKIIFGGKDKNLYVLDNSGKLLWSLNLEGDITNEAVYSDEYVFVAAGRKIYCIVP